MRLLAIPSLSVFLSIPILHPTAATATNASTTLHPTPISIADNSSPHIPPATPVSTASWLDLPTPISSPIWIALPSSSSPSPSTKTEKVEDGKKRRTPTHNGCGPKHFGWLVPEYRFHSCCNAHDECFHDCAPGALERCNADFMGCMRGICSSSSSTISASRPEEEKERYESEREVLDAGSTKGRAYDKASVSKTGNREEEVKTWARETIDTTDSPSTNAAEAELENRAEGKPEKKMRSRKDRKRGLRDVFKLFGNDEDDCLATAELYLKAVDNKVSEKVHRERCGN